MIEEILRAVGVDQLHTLGLVDGRGLCVFLRGMVGKPWRKSERSPPKYLNHDNGLCEFGSLIINEGGWVAQSADIQTFIYVNHYLFCLVKLRSARQDVPCPRMSHRSSQRFCIVHFFWVIWWSNVACDFLMMRIGNTHDITWLYIIHTHIYIYIYAYTSYYILSKEV